MTSTVSILLQLQSIPTVGASDVVSFQAPNGDWYITIASREDNEGNPNVDSLVLRWNGTKFEQTQVCGTAWRHTTIATD